VLFVSQLVKLRNTFLTCRWEEMSAVFWKPVIRDNELSGHNRESWSHSQSICVRMLQQRNLTTDWVKECWSLTGKAKCHLHQGNEELHSRRTIGTHSTGENINLKGKIRNKIEIQWIMKRQWQTYCASMRQSGVISCYLYSGNLMPHFYWPYI
jgi:hypothetical protein